MKNYCFALALLAFTIWPLTSWAASYAALEGGDMYAGGVLLVFQGDDASGDSTSESFLGGCVGGLNDQFAWQAFLGLSWDDNATMIGGSAEALETARPYLEATTDVALIHAGELGNGAKLKLCINLITYIQWAAAYESMALARAIGLPQEVLEQAGRSNGQLTELMTNFLATHKVPEATVKDPGYQNLMRGYMKIAEKDLAWALELARKADVALPVGSLVSQSMARIYNVDDPGRR